MALHIGDEASSKSIALSVIAVCSLLSLFSLLTTGVVVTGQSRAEAIHVTIDVKPGDTPTSIEPKREGMIPVAILTTREFDASRVDPATVRIGASGAEAAVFRSMSEDIDKDGDTDLLLLFRVQEMKLECRDATLRLRGKTLDGQQIEGEETVNVEGCA